MSLATKTRYKTIDTLGHLFSNPPAEYRPVPWWAWAGKLDLPTMKKQLHLMHEQGIREFFIFPIYGLEVEYLGNEYLDAVGIVLEWCRELGMRVWIYDEYTWPSGTAGGRVPRHHPDATAWVLKVEKHYGISTSEARKLLADPTVLHACVLGLDGGINIIHDHKLPAAEALNIILYRLERDQTQNMTVRAGLWCKGEPGMLDMLSPSACRSFLEEAYEPIAARFSSYFGSTLVGFFTDEPMLVTGPLYAKPTDIPWTPELPARFCQEFGYELAGRLHDLTFDTETAERTRADFWSLVADMSSNSFTGQIAGWCEQHGLLLTGHLWPEETSISVYALGDIYHHLRKMHVPGCDLLNSSTSFDLKMNLLSYAGPSSIKTPKLPASAARFAGRKRVMCEAFGVEPWTRTMADEKKVTDWLVALGVNLINDNSLISDISGFRKRALSGKHFTQPWWRYAHLYYDYAGRLCAISSETTLDTELAVLFPTTTWQSLARLGQDECSEAAKTLALDVTLEALVRKHWDFELLFEDVLADSTIESGVLVTNCGRFRTVILAGIHRLSSVSAARLADFASSGGRVILVCSFPSSIEHDGEHVINLRGAVTLGGTYAISLSDGQTLRDFYRDWVLSCSTAFADELEEVLQTASTRKWIIEGQGADGTISAARTDRSGRSLLFLANQTPGDKDLTIRWNGNWDVELWDPATGHRWRPNQSHGKCTLRLPEGESFWMVQRVSEASICTAPPDHLWEVSERQPTMLLDGTWMFRPEPANVFRVPCKLFCDKDGNLNPGDTQMQHEDSWLSVEWGDAGIPLDPESMRAYWLRMEFDLMERVDNLHIVVDSSDVEAAYLNGERLEEPQSLTVWDDANLVWDIGGRSMLGRNRMLLRVRTSPYYARHVAIWPINTRIVEPVVLRGSFAAHEIGSIVRLRGLPQTIEVGDWGLQGFPHFTGTGVYERAFTWHKEAGQVVFACDCGRDVVEVILDGVSLGIRAWGPRQFVARMSPGEHHTQVRVTNTLGGVLRRTFAAEEVHQVPECGLLSPVRIFMLG